MKSEAAMIENSLAERLKNELTQRGVWGLAQKCCKVFSRYLYQTTSSIWYVRKLEEPVEHVSPDDTFKVEFLTHDKYRLVDWLRENKSAYPWIYFEKEIDAALRNDHLFLIILHQDRIVGYVKLGVGHIFINDFDRMIEFQPGTAFVYDTFTLPEYRGKGLALIALNHASEYLKLNHFTQIFCHIERWNTPSIKTFEKAGFRDIDTIRFVRSTCFSFFIRSGYIPFLNLEKYLRSYT